MLLLGHMGFGGALARPFSRGLPLRFVLLGTLLPDLVDKPLYYGLAAVTGRGGAELGLVSGTRTFGHTALLLLALLAAARWQRAATLLALAAGMATHVPLDLLLDLLAPGPSSAWLAFTFPAHGLRFAVLPFRDPLQHLSGVIDPLHLASEAAGAALLAWLWTRTPRASSAAAAPYRERAGEHGRRERPLRRDRAAARRRLGKEDRCQRPLDAGRARGCAAGTRPRAR